MKPMLNSIACIVCLCVFYLSAASAQYFTQIFTNAVTASSNQVYGGSSTEDVVGNTYQVFMFTSGSMTIGGITLVNKGGLDAVLVKYGPLGNVTWVRTLQSPGNEEFFQVTTDPAGNVYACGWTDTSQDGITVDASWDGILVKYDSNGNLQYVINSYSHTYFSGQQDGIQSIIYSDNFLYFVQTSNYQVYMVFQTNLQGVVQWNYQLPASNLYQLPSIFQIAVDPLRNNIYLAGQLYGPWGNSVSNGKTITGFVSQNLDGFLFAISTSGFAQWVQPQQSSNNDYSYSVAVDAAGYVYVGGCIGGSVDGQSYSGGGQCNPFVQKYDWNGNRQWTRIYSQFSNYATASILMDNTGAFYTRAITSGNNGYQNIIKSDTNGNVIWIQGLQGATDVLVGCQNYLPYSWCRGGSSASIDGSGALTLSGVFSSQFFGWASNYWVPYVSKWQLNNTCQSCAQFDAVLNQLQTLLNVVVN